MPPWNSVQLCFYVSILDIDLVLSSDNECKLPAHRREANKYPKHEIYNKNRTNDTDTGEIYDTATILVIVFWNFTMF